MCLLLLNTVQTYFIYSHCFSAKQEWDLCYSICNQQCCETQKFCLSVCTICSVFSHIFKLDFHLLVSHYQCHGRQNPACVSCDEAHQFWGSTCNSLASFFIDYSFSSLDLLKLIYRLLPVGSYYLTYTNSVYGFLVSWYDTWQYGTELDTV